MNKFVRYGLYALGGLILFLGMAVAYIVFMFDPNALKPQIERIVGEKTQRQLTLGGAIDLKIWPTVSATVNGARWSEYRSTQPFVELKHIQVDLAFWPLLERRYVIKSIEIDGLSGQVTRYADGRLSIQDLIDRPEQAESKQQAVEFAIDAIRVRDAKFQFDDRQQKRLSVVNHLNFSADKVQKDSLEQVNLAGQVINSAPVVNAVISIKSERIRFPEGQAVTLENTRIETSGAAAGYRLQAVALDAARLQGQANGPVLIEGFSAQGGASGRPGTVQIARLELKQARWEPAKPTQVESLKLSLKGSTPDANLRLLNVDLPRGAFDGKGTASFDGLLLHAEGDYQDYRNIKLDMQTRGSGGVDKRNAALKDLTIALSAHSAGQSLAANLKSPSLSFAKQTVQAGQISGTVSLKSAQQAINAKLQIGGLNARLVETVSLARLNAQGNATFGKNATSFVIDTPLSVGLKPLTIDAPALKLNANIKTPTLRNGSFPLAVTGKARADVQAQNASAQLSGRFDTSGGRMEVSVEGFDQSAIKLNAALDHIDLDRYLAPATPASDTSSAAPKTAGNAANPFDLSALAPLKLGGKISIGKITREALQATDLDIRFNTGNGRISVPELSVRAFEGRMQGSLSATTTARPTFQIKQTLGNVNIGQVLKTFADLDKLEGRGDAEIDVTASGANLDELKRTVNGTVALKVLDGAWKGINLGKTLRESQALIRGQLQTRQATKAEQTDFSEITATVKLTDGIAYNDDLRAKSPLLRLTGKGQIALPSDSVDYVAQVSVVNTSKGQGGKDLAQLEGLTVPIRIRGPFDNLSYTLDYANMLKEATKAKLEEQKKALEAQAKQQIEAAQAEAQKRLDEEKAKAQSRLEEEKQKARQQLENQLKKGLGDLLRPRQQPVQPQTPAPSPATPQQPAAPQR